MKPTIFDNGDATVADDNDNGKLLSCRVIGEIGSHGWSCSTPHLLLLIEQFFHNFSVNS